MVTLPIYTDEAPTQSGGGCGGCEAAGGDQPRCGNGLEKVYKTTAVRYGYMRHIGEFTHPDGMKFTCGARVVIQTQRGIELGEQVSLVCSGCDKHVSRDQIRTYISNSGPESYTLSNGRILREATPDDLAEEVRLRDHSREMKSFAQRRADGLGLKMKVVECEYLLGGERSIFYFVADGRVDFRALVKDLSKEFQTRIKMHQVGARDEARLLADYETCGREVCCKVFLKTLRPVTMRMAKLQRATLDPSKVSGRCGRLKCCLRYEHESYESMDKRLPKKGEKIKTVHGYGVVIDRQILTQLVQIARVNEAGVVTVVGEDILERKLSEFPPDAAEFTMQADADYQRAQLKPPAVEAQQDHAPPAAERGESPGDRKGGRSRRRRRSDRPRKQTPAEGAQSPPADASSPTDKPKRRRRRRRRGGGGRGRPEGPGKQE